MDSAILAPKITALPAPVPNAGGMLFTVDCDPQVLPQQSVTLALGPFSANAQPFEIATAAPTFQFPTLSGKFLARLRVDGVESPVDVDWTAKPPVFKNPYITV